MRRIMIIPAAVILATLTLGGCSANSVATDQSGGMTPVESAPQLSRDGVEFTATEGVATTDRQVITTGYVTITVDKPVDAAAEAVRITEQSGGRVDGRTETAPVNGNAGSATLTLRLPSDTLTATLDKLRELGAVQEVSLNSADVTMETQDLDARIKAMSASIDRLLALLSTATDTDNLIALETAVSDRQAQLESMESQQRYYADQISLSTVTLNLVSDFTGPVAEPDNFLSGLIAGWNAFVAFFAGLLVAIGVLLPWLVFLGLVTVIIIFVVKRRSKSKKASASTRPPETVDSP